MLWRRLDSPGHDYARWLHDENEWRLTGVALFADESGTHRLDYVVACDEECRTRYACVTGWSGDRPVKVDISVSPERRWWLNGVEQPGVEGAQHLDLAFTPATNSLPVRTMAVLGEDRSDEMTAWLRFPGFALEPLRQTYDRTGPDTFRYSAPDLDFTTEIVFGADGFPVTYPGLWASEAPTAAAVTR